MPRSQAKRSARRSHRPVQRRCQRAGGKKEWLSECTDVSRRQPNAYALRKMREPQGKRFLQRLNCREQSTGHSPFFSHSLSAIFCFPVCALHSGSRSFQPCSLSGDKSIKTLNHRMGSKYFSCKNRDFYRSLKEIVIHFFRGIHAK